MWPFSAVKEYNKAAKELKEAVEELNKHTEQSIKFHEEKWREFAKHKENKEMVELLKKYDFPYLVD